MKKQLMLLAALTSLALPPPASAADATTDVVTVTVGPTIPSDEPSYRQHRTFTSAVLNSTNFYRDEHNATALTWNSTLEDYAADYLDGNGCEFEHSGGPYGENLAIGYENATAAVEAWGDEGDEYDFEKGKFSEATGHFTQLVWKDTTDVGCGRRLCGEKGWFLACEYWPRGNVVGEFTSEVQSGNGSGSGSSSGNGHDDIDGGGGGVRRPEMGMVFGVVLGLVVMGVCL